MQRETKLGLGGLLILLGISAVAGIIGGYRSYGPLVAKGDANEVLGWIFAIGLIVAGFALGAKPDKKSE